jgi:hypothetical protein
MFLATTNISHRKPVPTTKLSKRRRAQEVDKSDSLISELEKEIFEFQLYINTVEGIQVRLVSFRYLPPNVTRQYNLLFCRDHPLHHTHFYVTQNTCHSQSKHGLCVVSNGTPDKLFLALRSSMSVDCHYYLHKIIFETTIY